MSSQADIDINTDAPILGYLIDHLFFPPRIDTSNAVDDWINTSESDLNLLSFVHRTIARFPASDIFTNHTALDRMDRIVKMLGLMKELQAASRPGPEQVESGSKQIESGSEQLQSLLMKAFMGMKEDDIVTFHLKVHNAAVIFFHRGTAITFYSFKVSPQNCDILEVSHRLRCSYPDTAVSISTNIFGQQNFLEELTRLISTLSAATIISQPPCNRAFRSLEQPAAGRTLRNREHQPWPGLSGYFEFNLTDQVEPIYITEFLTGILRGVGEGVNLDADGGLICKQIADDALLAGPELRHYNPCFFPPRHQRGELTPDAEMSLGAEDGWTNTWRRSSIWLVIRVTLQISLLNSAPMGINASKSHCAYKLLILYILTRILEIGNRLDELHLPAETLSHMSKKVTRRAAKLEAAGIIIPSILLKYVSETVRCTVGMLEKRFEQIRHATVRELKFPRVGDSELERDRDQYTNQTMERSRDYIKGVLTEYHAGKADRSQIGLRVATSSASYAGEQTHHNTSRDRLPLPDPKWGLYPGSMDVEHWVEITLEDFISANINSEEACRDLYGLFASYAEIYSKQDSEWDPLGDSLQLLTAMELWVGLDKIATSIIPLLKEYPPEVNLEFFIDHLLLPTTGQLKRLQNISTYLEARWSRVTRPSIFTHYREINKGNVSVADCDTFSVRYFDQSPPHQALRDYIECAMPFMRPRNLYQTAGLTWDPQISSNELKAKATVLELDPPVAFAVWRDATYRATLGFQRMYYARDRKHTPNQEAYIIRYFAPDEDTLATCYSPKSKLLSCVIKRKTLKIAMVQTASSGVTVVNWDLVGFKYLTKATHEYIGDTFAVSIFIDQSPFHMRDLSYINKRQLQVRSGCVLWSPEVEWNEKRTPNSVICHESTQSPPGWPRHKYYVCAMLPVGHRLRWLNILREIKAGNLSLNRVATLNLFLQASWQTGPLGSSGTHLRETHAILHDVDFCKQMLHALEASMTVIKQSWFQQTSMQLVVFLGIRILSLARDSQVKTRAVYFLRVCRAVCMDWLLDMFQHLGSSSDGESQGMAKAGHCRCSHRPSNFRCGSGRSACRFQLGKRFRGLH